MVLCWQMEIVERNGDDYLSIGERFSPLVYFIFSTLFFVTGLVWAGVLRTANGDVFKLHYVMLVLIFFKAVSLLCHGVSGQRDDGCGHRTLDSSLVHITREAYSSLFYCFFMLAD